MDPIGHGAVQRHASVFDRPDFPRHRVTSLRRIPVPMEAIAFRQHAWSYGMHKRVDINRHGVVFFNDDTLDIFNQSVALGQVGAGLMLGPEFLDVGFTHQGGRAAADRIDANRVLGTSWTRANDLHHGTIARIASAALAELGTVHRTLQRLQFASNADSAQVR